MADQKVVPYMMFHFWSKNLVTFFGNFFFGNIFGNSLYKNLIGSAGLVG